MGLFKRNSPDKPQSPRNPDLVEAIRRVLNDPAQSNRQTLHQAFLNSKLLLGVQSLPTGISSFPTVLEDDTPVSVLTSVNPEGKEVLLVFSDVKSLRARNPSVGWIAMSGRDILEQALENHFAGIIINPAGSWIELSPEEMKSLTTDDN
ncbi:MAG: SseB family protein [Pyrinomonadaceae bacterium]